MFDSTPISLLAFGTLSTCHVRGESECANERQNTDFLRRLGGGDDGDDGSDVKDDCIGGSNNVTVVCLRCGDTHCGARRKA